MKALYFIRKQIVGFDFFCWLVMQKAFGATEIVFDIRNPRVDRWPLATVMRRFESILRPGPALVGLPYSIGTDGGQVGPYHQRDLVRVFNEGREIPRLKSVLPPGNERYTVTLRSTQNIGIRNSNQSTWRTFATEIGARVIEDYDVEPIGLHERMALYAGAEMNFFVTNGPAILCALSEYPMMHFDNQKSSLAHIGVPYGEKYPFMLPQHQMIYEPDDLPVIRKHFAAWRDGKDNHPRG
ncbi:MAG: hypothetical protein ACTS6J_01980 [Burkholderiales bacterium]